MFRFPILVAEIVVDQCDLPVAGASSLGYKWFRVLAGCMLVPLLPCFVWTCIVGEYWWQASNVCLCNCFHDLLYHVGRRVGALSTGTVTPPGAVATVARRLQVLASRGMEGTLLCLALVSEAVSIATHLALVSIC